MTTKSGYITKKERDQKHGEELCKLANERNQLKYEISALKKELQSLRDQKPVAWELPSIPPRIVLHPDFNANYGGTVKPLYAAPMPAPEGFKLVPIDPTEEMLDVYQTWIREGLQHMDIGIIKAIIEAAPKEPS